MWGFFNLCQDHIFRVDISGYKNTLEGTWAFVEAISMLALVTQALQRDACLQRARNLKITETARMSFSVDPTLQTK